MDYQDYKTIINHISNYETDEQSRKKLKYFIKKLFIELKANNIKINISVDSHIIRLHHLDNNYYITNIIIYSSIVIFKNNVYTHFFLFDIEELSKKEMINKLVFIINYFR